jgi:hypothetical protein
MVRYGLDFIRNIHPEERHIHVKTNVMYCFSDLFSNPLNTELNPMYHIMALLETHPIVHVSGVRGKEQSMTNTSCCEDSIETPNDGQ